MKIVSCAAPLQELCFKRTSFRQGVPPTRELVLRAVSSGRGEWPEKIKGQANVMSVP